MPKVFHVGDADIPDDAVSVGRDTIHKPQVDFVQHVRFMKDFEPEYVNRLTGKHLICDCNLNSYDFCHGDILFQYANPPKQQTLF